MARGRGDQVDTNFTRGALYKIWEDKKCPEFGAILDNFRLNDIANISGTDRHIEDRKSTWSTTFRPLLGETKFGELWSTNKKLQARMLTHPTGLFSGDYISAPRRRWPLKFLHTPDTGRGLLAHTTNRVGDPPKNFNCEHLKLGLKFHIWAPITFWVVDV